MNTRASLLCAADTEQTTVVHKINNPVYLIWPINWMFIPRWKVISKFHRPQSTTWSTVCCMQTRCVALHQTNAGHTTHWHLFFWESAGALIRFNNMWEQFRVSFGYCEQWWWWLWLKLRQTHTRRTVSFHVILIVTDLFCRHYMSVLGEVFFCCYSWGSYLGQITVGDICVVNNMTWKSHWLWVKTSLSLQCSSLRISL